MARSATTPFPLPVVCGLMWYYANPLWRFVMPCHAGGLLWVFFGLVLGYCVVFRVVLCLIVAYSVPIVWYFWYLLAGTIMGLLL